LTEFKSNSADHGKAQVGIELRGQCMVVAIAKIDEAQDRRYNYGTKVGCFWVKTEDSGEISHIRPFSSNKLDYKTGKAGDAIKDEVHAITCGSVRQASSGGIDWDQVEYYKKGKKEPMTDTFFVAGYESERWRDWVGVGYDSSGKSKARFALGDNSGTCELCCQPSPTTKGKYVVRKKTFTDNAFAEDDGDLGEGHTGDN